MELLLKNWRSTWKRLTETLRATLRLNHDRPAERNSAGARQSQGGGVRSGGTPSILATAQETKACDAFRETIGAADPDEFERPGLDGRAIFTSTLQAGRRRARRVGSGGTRCSLPAVQEEKVCDAFLERDVPGGTQNRGRALVKHQRFHPTLPIFPSRVT
eukprot:1431303-Amphidinium_carterae.1